MQNFNYYNPANMYFGKGEEKKVGQLTSELTKTKNVLVLFSGDYYNFLGISAVIKEQFNKFKINYIENGDIVPNPEVSLVNKLANIVRENKIDFILAVGGGSVIDTAKAVSFSALYDSDAWDFFQGKVTVEKSLPIGVISTAASSGSEMSNATIIDNGEFKLGVETNLIIPKFSILNPEYTLKVPAFQTGAGISDMMSHMLERYFTIVKDVNLTDRMLEGAMTALMATAYKLTKDPTNYELRAEIMWTAVTAHNNSLESGREPDWGSHRIEHELSAEYGITHGEGMAIVFPAWMKYVSKELPDKFVQLASRMFNIDTYAFSQEEVIDLLIKRFTDFFTMVGMHKSLKEIGIKDDSKFKEMGLHATHDDKVPVGHYKKLYSDDIVKILNIAL
ncbi:iron-containing alcohol dehydrogenase [Lactobacillus sp. ESL0679]|uniref:iron-containing alcohol dehydrogenase n=1 Tax=Lactobacillus sp. ESL0679 TaxID=2983209 RepID=UPI0023F973AF|nr:iron-containing alcohol dehydrogenase [Lactobacillus sp. ESL0679]MDF7682706.1 iron-containing alcohol dehydrogenase [Lactobacillus sp. ESL0679]